MPLKVRDLMTRDVVTLGADDILVTAEEVMGLRRFRHLPVVEGRDKLVGLVTYKDILRATANQVNPVAREAQKARTQVRYAMQTRVATVSPETDLREAADKMVGQKFGCLPVVEDERLVGILTEADFVKMVRHLLDHAEGDAKFMEGLRVSVKA